MTTQSSTQGTPSNTREKSSKGGPAAGNFANDREKASEAGKKGGEHSHGGGNASR